MLQLYAKSYYQFLILQTQDFFKQKKLSQPKLCLYSDKIFLSLPKIMTYKLVSDYKPTGDQPQAIVKLVDGINKGEQSQVLLGVTGSGKTFAFARGRPFD